MLQNNKGFFLLELLLSLSALLLLCLYLLPLLMDVTTQAQQLEIKGTAKKLLYAELQSKLIGNRTFIDYEFLQNRIVYKINWQDTSITNQKEVCVKVEKTSSLPETKVCGFLE